MASSTIDEENTFQRGDLFKNGRYVVQSKLGFGTFSTVWLAWDTQFKRYVALKIIKNKSWFTETAEREIKILKIIAKNDPEDKQPVVKLLDDFRHIGSYGRYICLVLELLGDNLKTLLGHYKAKGIPLHMVKEICVHVLRGLDYLHRRVSIIHTDLKPENILLVSPIDPKKDPKMIGAPFLPPSNNGKSAIASSSKRSKSIVQSSGNEANAECVRKNMAWGTSENLNDVFEGKHKRRIPCEMKSMEPIDARCKIADLGNGRQTTKQSIGCIQTLHYRCPETLIHSPFSTSADLWSFACIAFELATGNVLFEPVEDKKTEHVVVSHLGIMMELLGVMPKKIAMGGNLSPDFFDENGDLKGYRKFQFMPLTILLQEKFKFCAKDADEFSDFLGPLLDFVPENRPTAGQVLQHPWLNGVPRILQPPSSSQAKKNDEVIAEDCKMFDQEEDEVIQEDSAKAQSGKNVKA